jgi:acyl-CoA synthetase (AMP-forming)/AMP-acid ligase II
VRAGADLTADAVRDYCRQHLAKFKVPVVVEFCEELPKTSVGKVEKKLLRRRVQDWQPIG